MTLIIEKAPGELRGLTTRPVGDDLTFPDPPRDPAPVLAFTVLDAKDRATMDAALGEHVIAAELEQTIDGASTLTIAVADPSRTLIRSGACSSAARVAINGRRFMLASVERAAGTAELRLTFEAEAVALLRRYTKPRAMYRDKVTRAQFLQALTREVRERRLAFQTPRDYDVTITPTRPPTTAAHAAPNAIAAASRGADTFRAARVKGSLANGEQRRLLALAMRICDELRAPFLIRAGLIACMTQESVVTHLPLDNAGSVGVLQAMPRYFGSKAYSDEWQIRHILTRGFTGSGGYEGVLKSYDRGRWGRNVIRTFLHHLNPGAIDGGGLEHNYRQWWDEARRTAHLWTDGGAGTTDESSDGSSASRSTQAVQRYAFRRGQSGAREDSWAAMRRLADEVEWALWVDGDTVHYAPEDWLIRQPAKWTIADGGAGIETIGYTIDHGRARDELRAVVHAGRWQAAIGDAAVVDGEGPADGKWLIAGIRRGFYDTDAELTLRRPTRALPEPAAEPATTTPDTGSGAGTTATGLRARIVEIAQAEVGHTSSQARSRYGYGPTNWCAAFSSWCWRKAGVSIPLWLAAVAAWDNAPASRRHYRPLPGDTIHYGRLHVGIVVKTEGDQVWTVDGNYSDAVTRRGPFHFRGYPPGGPAAILGYVSPPGA